MTEHIRDGEEKQQKRQLRTRSGHQIQADLIFVSENYLRGVPFREILKQMNEQEGREFPMTIKGVYKELDKAKDMWQKMAADNIDRAKGIELQKIDLLERTYWEQFEKSKETVKSSRTKQGGIIRAGKVANPDYATIEETERTGIGDVKWLERVEWCIQQRCEILGIKRDAAITPPVNAPRTIIFKVHDRFAVKPGDGNENIEIAEEVNDEETPQSLIG